MVLSASMAPSSWAREPLGRRSASRSVPAHAIQVVADPMERAVVLAVEALDDIVASLIASNPLAVPPRFLDWVVDDATPRVATRAKQKVQERGAHEGAGLQSRMRLWVYEWFALEVQERFARANTKPADSGLDLELV